MKYISLKKAQAGMVIGYDVRDNMGRILVSSGMVLTDTFIEKLKALRFNGIYIQDALSEGIEINNALDPEMRVEAMECIQKADIDTCMSVASKIVEQILYANPTSLDLADLRSFDDYTFSHSVNVAVYSCVLGLGMGLNGDELKNLVMAALVHDLGKLRIPPEILNKAGRLTSEEYEIIKNHPKVSYQLIAGRPDISSHIKVAVLYHHENVDGSGYPDGILGEDMTIYTKILHVADVYDALVSRRPYKEPYSPAEAAEYLMGGCGIMFDYEVVSKFIKYVPLYPKGTEVTLSNGKRGIIFDNSNEHNLRPVVRLTDFTLVDLSAPENLSIGITITSDEFSPILLSDELSRKEMIEGNRKNTVMIVDDLVSNLQMLREILDPFYKVILCKSGEQALSYLNRADKKIDLILMDIDMPQMNGIEATQKIREMGNIKGNVPVMFVSSLHDKDTVLACRKLSAEGYVVMPYNPIFVKAEVERIIGGR